MFLQLASRYLQGCPDGAGSHDVDSDAFGGHLFGQGAAEGNDGRLGGGVVNQVFARLVGLNGRTGDDAGSRLEVGEDRLGNPE